MVKKLGVILLFLGLCTMVQGQQVSPSDQLAPTSPLVQQDTAAVTTDEASETPKKSNTIDARIEYTSLDSMVITGKGVAHMYGSGELQYKSMNLTAEYIRMHMDSSTLYAKGVLDTIVDEWVGKPVFTEGEDSYTAKCNLNKDIIIEGLENLKKFDEPIQITNNDIFITLRPLKFKDYIKLVTMFDIGDPEKLDKVNFMYTSLLLTFSKIYTKESSFDPKDYSMDELSQFYENFPQGDKIKIQEMYNNLPKIALRFHYVDKKGKEKYKDIEKADFNFFG
jgi:hypothetical protein